MFGPCQKRFGIAPVVAGDAPTTAKSAANRVPAPAPRPPPAACGCRRWRRERATRRGALRAHGGSVTSSKWNSDARPKRSRSAAKGCDAGARKSSCSGNDRQARVIRASESALSRAPLRRCGVLFRASGDDAPAKRTRPGDPAGISGQKSRADRRPGDPATSRHAAASGLGDAIPAEGEFIVFRTRRRAGAGKAAPRRRKENSVN